MPFDKHVICVSTTKPSTTLTPNGAGGSMTLLDPMTGSFLSSFRATGDISGKSALGIQSASSFPYSFSKSSGNTRLVLAYGGNSSKKGDTYAMLLSIRAASSPPILHWKCRLPEAELTGGLIVSPCGYYIIGGGSSGSCYVWNSLGGGSLLKTFKAHYRAVTCMAWSDCGRYLVTGGADGMVHLFPLMELVDKKSRNSKRAVAPLNTWSSHHFAVTCLATMESGRVASGAEDGQVIVMELFSKEVVASIKAPCGVNCLTYYGGRLFAGSTRGTIFSMDLNAYAMLETEKQGATLSQAERKRQKDFLAAQERILGKPKEGDSASTRLYQSDWRGHERAVTSIAFLVEEHQELLISGDELGQIRIWDVQTRACLKVLHPWSNSGGLKSVDASKQNDKASPSHPISSIVVLAQPTVNSQSVTGMFGASTSSGKSKGQTGIASLIGPLQKYTEQQLQDNDQANSDGNPMPVPFLKPDLSMENLAYWQARTIPFKRKRSTHEDDEVETEKPIEEATHSSDILKAQERIAQLEQELAKKTEEVERWEKVNNKLMAKLKKK